MNKNLDRRIHPIDEANGLSPKFHSKQSHLCTLHRSHKLDKALGNYLFLIVCQRQTFYSSMSHAHIGIYHPCPYEPLCQMTCILRHIALVSFYSVSWQREKRGRRASLFPALQLRCHELLSSLSYTTSSSSTISL